MMDTDAMKSITSLKCHGHHIGEKITFDPLQHGYYKCQEGTRGFGCIVTEVDLMQCGLTSIPSRLKDIPSIKKLILNYNKITRIQDLDMPTLDELHLSGNQIERIEGLDGLKDLRSLNLDNNKIVKIENLHGLENLERLSMDSNKLSKIGGLDNLLILNHLWLQGNEITKIEGLEKLQNLEELSLGKNRIAKIEGLDSLVTLDELNLEYNDITKIEGLDAIAFPKGQLKSLNLRGNDIPLKDVEKFDEDHPRMYSVIETFSES